MVVALPIVFTASAALAGLLRQAHTGVYGSIFSSTGRRLRAVVEGDEPLEHEHVLSLNEKLFTNDLDKDIVFSCSDGEIAAHKCVLRAASDVLGEIIDQEMEGEDISMIEVPDTTVEALQVFLRVLYTGLMDPVDWHGKWGSTIPLDLLLDISIIANTYMVSSIQFLTTEALKKRLRQAHHEKNVKNFEQIWAGALECAINPVCVLAMSYAQNFPALHKAFNADDLIPEVATELESLWPAASNQYTKQKMQFE